MKFEEAKKYMDNGYFAWKADVPTIIYWYGNWYNNTKIIAKDLSTDEVYEAFILSSDESIWYVSWHQPKYGVYYDWEVIS